MIWRWRFRFREILESKPTSDYFVKRQSLASICNLASPIECSTTDKHQSFACFPTNNRQELLTERSRSVVLTPQIVQTTLLNCPSDIVALSFFLWCARQTNYFHDRTAFGHMVHVVSRLTHNLLTVRGILDELKLVGCTTKPQSLLLLMRIFWFGRMYDLVFEAFEEMLQCGYTPNTFARNIFMDVLFKIGRVDVALKVLEETKVPNFLTLSIAICNLCKLNDLINLRIVLQKVLRNGYCLNPDTFLLVLNSYCKSGRLEEALQLLGLMIISGVPSSVNIWSVLIDGLCKSGQVDIACYLLDKMIESGFSPNVVTWTSLIKGLVESEKLTKAFMILNSMKSKGCYPDLVLSNVLIDCLSKVGSYDDALGVFYNLRKRRLAPDPYTFSSLVSVICSSRQFLLLPLLISGLVIEPDLVMCNSLLSYYCKAGYPTGAVEFYNDMIDRGFIPDKYSYAGLLCGLCKLGRIHEAVNVYCGIILQSHLSIDAHVHTIIMDGLIKSGNFHSAIKFFRKAAAENVPLDVVSYTVAINGLLRGGRAEEAYTLFRQMKDTGIAPNIHTYNLILSGFCKDKNCKMIKVVLQEMSYMGVEVDYNTCKLVKNFLYKSRNFDAVHKQFVELSDSGLLPEKLYAVLIGEFRHDAIIDAAHQGSIVEVQDVNVSSSDEYYCMAASVG